MAYIAHASWQDDHDRCTLHELKSKNSIYKFKVSRFEQVYKYKVQNRNTN